MPKAQHTAYTHAYVKMLWLKWHAMASVESEAQALFAQALGYRTFRVIVEGEPLLPNEIPCPNQTHKVTCAQCMLCDGRDSAWERITGRIKKSIAVVVHGSELKGMSKPARFAIAKAKQLREAA